MKVLVAISLAAALAASSALAGPALVVTGAWSRPAVAGTNAVGYLTVTNHGAKADAIVGVAESPLAAHVDMHESSMAGGVMSMKKVASVAAPPGGRAEFAPGGYHLMLMGLTRTLKPGDRAPVTVTFASGAKLKTQLTVGVGPPAGD